MKKYLLFTVLSILIVSAEESVKSKAEIVSKLKENADHLVVDELKKELSDGELLLIDIRTRAEYDGGHLAGAAWIPLGKLPFTVQKKTEDPDKRIVLYCRTGGRSALGVKLLKELCGFRNIADLNNGFSGWIKSGEPIYNLHGEIRVTEYRKKEPSPSKR